MARGFYDRGSTGMPFVSILNDVLGPIMRGPSSSHTAGPFFIGAIFRSMLGEAPRQVTIAFDPAGSFASVYRGQKSDTGFAAGLCGLGITDAHFHDSLVLADSQDMQIEFTRRTLSQSHPNAVLLEGGGDKGRLSILAASIGGGQVRVDAVDGIPVEHDCRRPRILLAAANGGTIVAVRDELARQAAQSNAEILPNRADRNATSLLVEGPVAAIDELAATLAVRSGLKAYVLPAVGLAACGRPVLALGSVQNVLESGAASLSQLGQRYESQLLGPGQVELDAQMRRRWDIMQQAIEEGLRGQAKMRLLKPVAGKVMAAAKEPQAIDGFLGQAAAAALAVMETNSSGGVVCAAPTGGSAGVLPGVLWACLEERPQMAERVCDGLWAAGVVGAMAATRATFAAEVCGCGAEVGVAAAMTAAALVEMHGGRPDQAMESASLCLMNCLGLVCDPVGGAVEIPCHGRNIAGAALAISSSQAVMGGFRAVMPLDEVLDAMLQVGAQLPACLRCTSQGGLAVTATARRL